MAITERMSCWKVVSLAMEDLFNLKVRYLRCYMIPDEMMYQPEEYPLIISVLSMHELKERRLCQVNTVMLGVEALIQLHCDGPSAGSSVSSCMCRDAWRHTTWA